MKAQSTGTRCYPAGPVIRPCAGQSAAPGALSPAGLTGARREARHRLQVGDALGDLVGGQALTRSVPNSSTLNDASAVP